ncbi:hypothetical protein [Streptomyces atratus]|uniref:hypothetical protein n=1 Tax=Streptomyces atratus TaxID=1893 RepID=UPI0033DE8FA9
MTSTVTEYLAGANGVVRSGTAFFRRPTHPLGRPLTGRVATYPAGRWLPAWLARPAASAAS